MNANGTIRTLLLALSFTTAAAFAQKNPLDEISSHDGLARVNVKGIDLAYKSADADIAKYGKLIVDPVEVAFRKDWNPTRPGSNLKLSAADRENIRTGVAKVVQEEFEKALKAGGGWQVVNEAGPDVLRLKPKILNLYVNAPDTRQAGVRTFTLTSGEMTLLLEAFDSESGAIVARVIDRQESRNTGQWQLSSSVSNVGDTREIAARWARILRDRLDKAKGAGKK
ncbi:MAG TPA: DUF3313 family protein [Usitatibacter sp.]|nr:DUF3313 family protein [Usitatibacter sp.]